MESDQAVERYELLYRMLGADGRCEQLFGSCGERAREAFRCCAVGSRMPLVYFEVPLLGEPRFDVQVCLSRADVMDVRDLPAGSPPALGPLLNWLRGSDDCVGVDLAFDVNAGEPCPTQVMALMREGTLRDVEGFFLAVGDRRAAERYLKSVRSTPAGWREWYVGFAAQRPGHPVRLDFSVLPKRQQAYLEDPTRFASDLRSMGYEIGEAQLTYIHELLGLPFAANLQLDVLEGGKVGPVLGYSLAMPHWGPARSREELAQGALGQAFLLVKDWGLADGRWRQLSGCCIGMAVRLPGMRGDRMIAVRCVPTFVKVRMTPAGLLDAKAYLMCTMSDFGLDQHGASCK